MSDTLPIEFSPIVLTTTSINNSIKDSVDGSLRSVDEAEDIEPNGDRNQEIRNLMRRDVSSTTSDSSYALKDSKDLFREYSLNCTNGRCAYCGLLLATYNGESRNWVKLEDRKMVADHLYPVCNGGPFMTGNIVYTCEDCNAMKGNYDWVTYLSFLHATSKRTFISDLKSHVKWIKKNFIERFVSRIPDQILKLMIRGTGVSKEECHMIRKINADPRLMTFTPSLQEKLVRESEARLVEVHGEFWQTAFPGYYREVKQISLVHGDKGRDQYWAVVYMFLWLVQIKEKGGFPNDDVLIPDLAIINHKDVMDPRMSTAGAVQEFMTPIMLSVKEETDSVNDVYQARKRLSDAGRLPSKPSDQTSTVYKKYCRSWNLLMKCWLQSIMARDNRNEDLEALVRNSILPPTKTALDKLLDLPGDVDPVSKLGFAASLALDETCSGKVDLIVEQDNESVPLDLHEWAPKDLIKIKDRYEAECAKTNTISPSGRKNYKILALPNLKDELFQMMLCEGHPLVDEDGRLNREGFRRVLLEKWKTESEAEKSKRRGVPRSSHSYGKISKLRKSIGLLSKIVLGEDVTAASADCVGVDADKNPVKAMVVPHDVAVPCLMGASNVAGDDAFHNRVRLLKMQCVMEDGSLSIEEKLAMIDAINGYDGA